MKPRLLLIDLQTGFEPAKGLEYKVYPLIPKYKILEILTVGYGCSLIEHTHTKLFKSSDDGATEVIKVLEPCHLDVVGVCRCYCLKETCVSLQKLGFTTNTLYTNCWEDCEKCR